MSKRLDNFLNNITSKVSTLKIGASTLTYNVKILYADGMKDESLKDYEAKNITKTIKNHIVGENVNKIEIIFVKNGKKLTPSHVFYDNDDDSGRSQQQNNGFSGFETKEQMLGEIETRATEVAEKRLTEILEKERLRKLEEDYKALKKENKELESELEKVTTEYDNFKSTYNQIKTFAGLASTFGATKLGAKLDGIALGFLGETEQKALQEQEQQEQQQQIQTNTDFAPVEKDKRQIALEYMNDLLNSYSNEKLGDMLELFKLIESKQENLRNAIYVLTEKQK